MTSNALSPFLLQVAGRRLEAPDKRPFSTYIARRFERHLIAVTKHDLGRQFTSATQPKRLKSGDAAVEGEGKNDDLTPEDVPMDVARASGRGFP
jgi:hypothetical protein